MTKTVNLKAVSSSYYPWLFEKKVINVYKKLDTIFIIDYMFAQFLKMRTFDSSFQPVVVEVKIIEVGCRFKFLTCQERFHYP